MHVLILTDQLGKQPSKDELDTRLQVKQVRSALLALGHTVSIDYFSMNLPLTGRRIERSGCEFVFNLVENLPSTRLLHLPVLVCETLSIPHSGANSFTLSVSGDKLVSKHLMDSAGLPVPKRVEPGMLKEGGERLILKPVDQEASIGITEASVSFFQTEEQLALALKDKTLFAEQYIDGMEFNLSILPGSQVLPPAKMCFLEYPEERVKVVGYEAKWEEDSFAYKHTVRTFDLDEREQQLAERLKTLALDVYTLLGESGYARVDFRVDENLNPYVLELNSNPCIANDSGFTASANKAGLTYEAMIDSIIKGACDGNRTTP